MEGNSYRANLALVSLSGFPRAPSVKVPIYPQGAAAIALHFITNIHRFLHFRCRISTILINLEQLTFVVFRNCCAQFLISKKNSVKGPLAATVIS